MGSSATGGSESGTGAGTERETTSGSGLEPNLAGALSYLLGLITGVIFFVVDEDDEFVRFHAAQSIVLSVVLIALNVVVSIISTIVFGIALAGAGGAGGGGGAAFGLFSVVASLFSILWSLVGLAVFLGWLYLMYTAYQGNRTRIPVVAEFADRLAAS